VRILFIPTVNPDKQGDLLEVSLLHGLRSVLGENLIDYPRKKIMYHDFSETKKETLHGRGNTLLTYPILDLSENQRKLENIDAIIYGDGHMYDESKIKKLHSLTKNIWVIDGHDLHGNAPRKIKIKEGDDEIEVIGVQFKKCFKRELVEDGLDLVFPTGFGIPIHRIRPICFSKKDQLFQKTAPDNSTFGKVKDLGGGFTHHKFTNEEDYYNDLSRSWFGLTCKKGGWDCLRHYEIIAAGSVLLFKDYNKKHPLCSPQNLPCLSYSTKDELNKIMNRLVVDNKPTDEYLYYLNEQRKWLYNVGTTDARALEIIKTIRNYNLK